jgi:hypothetical protein
MLIRHETASGLGEEDRTEEGGSIFAMCWEGVCDEFKLPTRRLCCSVSSLSYPKHERKSVRVIFGDAD